MDEESSSEKETEKEREEPKKSKEENFTGKIRKNPWILSTLVLGVLTLILLVSNFSGFTGSAITGGVISGGEAGEKLLKFYESNGVTGLELGSVEEESGLYKVNFNYQGQVVPVYVTRDGTLAGSLAPVIEVSTNSSSDSQTQEIPKSEKPQVDLYVMSFCPYGNRGEDTMLPVYNLLKDNVDWNIHYIVSVSGDTIRSLHGQPEIDQNIREVCVKRDYGLDAFWKFINYVNQNCGGDGNCWEDAAKEAGADPTKIQSCFDNDGLELMKVEAAASNKAGATGSPTLLINGVKSNTIYQYENSEAYKQAICNAFNEAPEECTTELTSSGTSAGGSC